MKTTYAPKWHLKGTPYPVQVEALKRSRGHDKYAYFMSMGLGKSALILNDWAENYTHIPTIIVIAPNSFRVDWTLMPGEWGVKMTTSLWPKDKMASGRVGHPHLNAINFEAVRTSGYNHIKELMDKHPCLLVIDESSAIKNFKSQTARAVLDLCKRAAAVRLLNGTPMVQNVMDVYPQLRAVGELDKVNPYAFRNRFAIMGGFMGKQVKGVQNEEELHRLLDRCSFRALKKDWWEDCPEQLDIPINLEMTNKQQKHYKEMIRDFLTIVEGHEYTANIVLSQLDKARQLTSGLILDGDRVAFIEPIEKNPKALAALDLMDSEPTKMIVVHFYRAMGLALYDFFKKKKLNPSFIRGGMKPNELLEQKAKFNDDPRCRIMVAQISSASLGHTLIAGAGEDRCHRMVFHDLTFNYRDWVQMRDRIHRGEQDRNCLYYVPQMSPVDAAQLKALITKQDLATAIVDAVRALRR